MTTSPDEFFTDQTIQSLTKARIVSKYFKAWSKLLGERARKRREAIRYVDLFAGRGRYADGKPSTPLLILQHVIDTPALHDLFLSRFNDADRDTALALEEAIQGLPGREKLKYQPQIHCLAVDDKIAEWFEAKNYVATLTFLDPFGYAGLSARLIRATLKDEGSECVFFFNFNRVNAATRRNVGFESSAARSACQMARAIFSPRRAASSTITRRLTQKNMRRGAVRSLFFHDA